MPGLHRNQRAEGISQETSVHATARLRRGLFMGLTALCMDQSFQLPMTIFLLPTITSAQRS